MLNFTAKPLAALALSSLCCACAMQPYEAKPIAPAQTAAQFQERNLASPELMTFMLQQGYPASSMPIKVYGLQELTLAAFHYHPQLDVARAKWQAAQAAAITAGQKPNPGISASGEHHSKTDGGVSPWTLGFSLDIPIETGGKREARMARAASLSEAARIDIGLVAWNIRSRLRKQLLDYHASLLQGQLLDREITLRQEVVSMLEKRLQAGLVSDMDLSQVRLLLQKTRQGQAAEQGRQPQLLAQIAEASGLTAPALENVTLASYDTAMPALPQAELQRAALLNRLDIRAALARYDAAEAKLKLEIAKQYPDLSIAPGYAFDQNDNRWSLGLSMLLALLNRNEGPIAEAQAQRELEARQFDDLQLRVIAELDQARIAYVATLDETAKAERLLAAQQARLAQTQRQFDAGHIDRLELRNGELEVLTAESGVLAASLKSLRALGMLEDAVQKPLNDSSVPAVPENKDIGK